MSIPLFGALEAIVLSPLFLFIVIGLATGAAGFVLGYLLGQAAERRRRKIYFYYLPYGRGPTTKTGKTGARGGGRATLTKLTKQHLVNLVIKLRKLSEEQRNALLYSLSATLGLVLLFQPLLTAGPLTSWTIIIWILFPLLTWGMFYALFKKREEDLDLHEINYGEWFLAGMIVFIVVAGIVAGVSVGLHIHYGYGFIGAFLVAVAIGRLSAYD